MNYTAIPDDAVEIVHTALCGRPNLSNWCDAREAVAALAAAGWLHDPTEHDGDTCAEVERRLDDAVGELNTVGLWLARHGVHIKRPDGDWDVCEAIVELLAKRDAELDAARARVAELEAENERLRDELRSVSELARGEGVRFENADDAVRWLSEPERVAELEAAGRALDANLEALARNEGDAYAAWASPQAVRFRAALDTLPAEQHPPFWGGA
jgi:hypothetical protein